ncbi:MAG: flagellar FlbD family protein [Acidobacterium ailaaui]|jgi:flagellar protein FlbD|nr:flagellar FlbD family protein [Pseudacidobacterium ailaaui]MCL6462944.1 flagellar FlbD family protein [Pseudacidobacterium ailaaui]MDI3254584.1 flagellar FlbD family protein [Bacillota bacterium]
MIELTRLNGQPMVVNSDLIKYVESSPDTMLTLIHGEKIVVAEPGEEVVRRVTEYRTRLLAEVMRRVAGGDAAAMGTAASGAAGLRIVAAQAALEDAPGEEEALLQRRRRDRSIQL